MLGCLSARHFFTGRFSCAHFGKLLLALLVSYALGGLLTVLFFHYALGMDSLVNWDVFFHWPELWLLILRVLVSV